ncbi:hypothetical protein [Glycomyces paridis]|uniref:hypothetical protein n=1 Tax=Glycomyces paridis TaxID=2126555 RepID=UPI0013053719|nr:hypothetical protein [Glycomyces paridis]
MAQAEGGDAAQPRADVGVVPDLQAAVFDECAIGVRKSDADERFDRRRLILAVDERSVNRRGDGVVGERRRVLEPAMSMMHQAQDIRSDAGLWPEAGSERRPPRFQACLAWRATDLV